MNSDVKDIQKDILKILKDEMEAFYKLEDIADKITKYIRALLEGF